MKLLVVGHSYVTAFAQAKYVAMKRLDSTIQLRILTPPQATHVFMTYRSEVAGSLSTDEVVPVRAFLSRSHMSYVLDPLGLATQLKDFAPEHIHIEEDPHSLVGLETVLLARLVCPESAISFFIWDNLWRMPRFPLSLMKLATTRICLARASLVVCGNTEGKELLRKKGYRGSRLVLPQFGLDPEDYDVRPPADLHQCIRGDRGDVVIGYLGRLVPEKGILLLLEALEGIAHLPWRLLLVGSGSLREAIRREWQCRFGSRLICLEPIPHKEVPAYLKCLDIFTLPSYGIPRWKEQFGLTLAQAMMAGVACVGSSSGAIPEVLGPGGLVFQERSAVELRHVLEKLIQSPGERQRLADVGQRFAMENYTNASIAKQYLMAFSSAGAGDAPNSVRC